MPRMSKKEEAGAILFPQRARAGGVQQPLPEMPPRLQTELPGHCDPLPPLPFQAGQGKGGHLNEYGIYDRRHQPAALSAPAGGHAGAAGEQHRQGYVCPSAWGRFIRRGRRTSTEFYLFNFPLWNWRRRWGAARRLASEPCGNWRTPDCSYGCAGRLERRTGFMSSFQEAKPLKNRRISRPKPFYKRSQVCYNKHMKLSV